MTSRGELRDAWTLQPARSSTRSRPCTRPLTVPRIETMPQSMSASMRAVSPTTSVLSETILPLTQPSIRNVFRKRSSPSNSVPSSMKPFRSSETSPFNLIIGLRPPRKGYHAPRSRGSSSTRRAEDRVEDPLELRLGGEGDAEHAPPPPPADLDPGPEGSAEALLGGPRVRVLAAGPGPPGRSRQGHTPLHLAHRESLPRGLSGEGLLLVGRLEGEEGSAVAGLEGARGQEVARLLRKAQEPDGVRDRGPVAPDPLGHVLLAHVELVVKALESLGLLEGRQFLTLDVLDQRELQHVLVAHVPDHDGDGLEAELLGGPKPPFSRDDLIAVAQPAHEDRLDHAALADGGRQLLEPLRRHGPAGLKGVRIKARERNVVRRRGRSCWLRVGQESGQPLAQRLSFHARSAPWRAPSTPPPPGNGCRRGGWAYRSSALRPA